MAEQPLANRRQTLLETFKASLTKIEDKYNPHYRDAVYLYYLIRDGTIQTPHAIHRVPTEMVVSIAISVDDPRLIQILHPQTGVIRNIRVITALKMIAKAAGYEISAAALEVIATVVGEELPTKYGYEILLTEGADIITLYRSTPYTCMTTSRSLDFYARNAPAIRAIKVLKDGRMHGRAIVWPLLNGNHYVDRIYPQSGAHYKLVLAFIKEQGWLHRETHGPERPADHPHAKELITAPVHAPDEGNISPHSHGAFPYMDTFTYMKHNPSKDLVMLRYEFAHGWVTVGPISMYQNRFYCPLLQGWEDEGRRITAHVINTDGSFRAETHFSTTALGRTHTLIRHPLPDGAPGLHRVYAPKTLADELTQVIGGAYALTKHAVTLCDGRAAYFADAAHMHDDTYVLLDGNLRNLAMLPTGQFVFRNEAEYDPETRTWHRLE